MSSNIEDRIKFVSYDGEYPCLCMGNLTLEVDGEEIGFGMDRKLPKFWTSGGSVSFDEDWNEMVCQGDWYWFASEREEKELPEVIVQNKDFVMELFNEHVPAGCCGGCV